MREVLGPLGRRLVLAFSLVSLVTVALLAFAAQRAVEGGIALAAAGGRAGISADLADLAAVAYAASDGWPDADLSAVLATAAEVGVRVAVRGADGSLIAGDDDIGRPGRATPSPVGTGTRTPGAGEGGGGRTSTAGWTSDVVVGAAVVGSVGVAVDADSEARAAAQGLDLAWNRIAGAAVAAVAFAMVAGWLVTRRLTRPLGALAAVTRAFAAGDRGIRAPEHEVGELGDLARGINEAMESAERSARARRQMAADVAHELRTPLAALQAGLEEVRDGLLPPEPDVFSRLHQQAVRLGRVVGDLGVLASADDIGPAVIGGRADLAAIAADALEARGPELRAAGIEVRAPELEPVVVLADADRLHQAVGNLLANVARHCRRGDSVEVRVRREGDEAVLLVRDNGPGIPPEHLGRAFDRYWRGRNEGVVGSGLGLAVVREVVTAHGGSVMLATPEDGVGTVAQVRLPAQPRDRSVRAGPAEA